jgi:hypothetical protein
MPGKRITDHQMVKYKRFRKQVNQEAAAIKVPSALKTAGYRADARKYVIHR